jgi:DNA-binding transcriptional regulator YhcF (GntR family)
VVVVVDDAGFEPPKYAQIVAAIHRRIADGTYPPGSLLPSESKLLKEFGVSRPTVVRALQALKLRGETDREHGRGSFVKATPALSDDAPRPVRCVLDRAEADEAGWTTTVERCAAPAAIAGLLGLAESAAVVLRRRLTIADDAPYELVSLWLPVELAETAGLDQGGPCRRHVVSVACAMDWMAGRGDTRRYALGVESWRRRSRRCAHRLVGEPHGWMAARSVRVVRGVVRVESGCRWERF